MPKFLTIADVMQGLQCSRTTVYELFRTGRLPKRMVAGCVRVLDEDYDAYVRSTLVVDEPVKARRKRPADVVEFF